MDVVVVSKNVAFGNHAVGVVEVVLRFLTSHAVVVGGKLVDVGVACASEEVFHGFVVHAFGGVELQTQGIFVRVVDAVIESGAEREHHLVVVSALLVVECLAACQLTLAVDVVHLIPIDLTIGFGGGPIVNQCVVLLKQIGVFGQVVGIVLVGVPNVEHAARQIFVVVGTRVVSIAAPSQSRCAVHAVLEAGRRNEFLVFVDVEIPCQDGSRFEVVHHAGIALFPVLITPVGVVIMRVGQPIHFLGGCRLLCAFGGRTECYEREAVAVADFLFGGQEVAE